MTRPRRLRLFFATMLVAVIMVDLGLGLFVIDGGRIGDRPLPPFEALPHPRQQVWFERQKAELSSRTKREGASVFDPELGWTNTPFAPDEANARCFATLGARGRREYAPEIPEGVTRILTFGDSFTYCDEVSDDESWQHQMESTRPDWELPNFGVGGYGTDQALLRFRRIAPKLEADAILLGINVENIARNVNRYRPLYHPRTASAVAKPRFLLEGKTLRLLPSPFPRPSDLVEAIENHTVLERVREHEYWFEPDTPLKHSSLLRLVLGWRAYSRRQPSALWSDQDGEPFRITLAILEAFHEEALASGARLAAIVISHRESDLAGPRFWKPLCSELDARGIPWIDLSHALGPPFQDGEPLFQGGHLSARGNELAAGAIEAFLEAHL